MYLGNSQIKKKKNDGGPCVLANQNLGAYVWAGLIVCLNWVIVGQIFSGSEKTGLQQLWVFKDHHKMHNCTFWYY